MLRNFNGRKFNMRRDGLRQKNEKILVELHPRVKAAEMFVVELFSQTFASRVLLTIRGQQILRRQI
jgi:hypothetical protein